MSLKRQGYQQSAAVAAGLDDQLEGMADKPATQLGTNTATSVAGIPGYYHTVDSHADTIAAYRGAAAGIPGVTGGAAGLPYLPEMIPPAAGAGSRGAGYQVSLTDKDIAYFEKRRQENLQAEFDDWVTYNINLSDPGESRWLQQVYPEFWSRREKYLDDKINVEARAAKIRARGIKDQSDLKFLFAVDRGMVTLPTSTAFAGTQIDYVKGWFRTTGSGATTTKFVGEPRKAAFDPSRSVAGAGDLNNPLRPYNVPI